MHNMYESLPINQMDGVMRQASLTIEKSWQSQGRSMHIIDVTIALFWIVLFADII